MNWNWPLIWTDERGGWWRVPVTYVLFGGAFFLVGSILAGMLKGWGPESAVKDGSVGLTAGVQLLLIVFPLCLGGLGCLLGIRIIHRKPVSCALTDGRPFRFGLFFQSAFIWGALWLVGVVLFPGGLDDLKERYHEIHPASWPGVCVALFCIASLQAAAEEIVDRGYLQTRVAAWVKRPWLSVAISTTVFTLLHTQEMTVAARVRIAVIGAMLGVALIRANTTAPLIGMHATGNALGAIWLPNWTNANRNWLDVAFICIQFAVWLKWLFWATRKDATQKRISVAS
jgi:membrane protease YdiL (CAAX protease family)